MNIFKTTLEAENAFAQESIRLITTAKDFFKDLATEFRNWAEGNIQVEEWDREDRDLSEAIKGQY